MHRFNKNKIQKKKRQEDGTMRKLQNKKPFFMEKQHFPQRNTHCRNQSLQQLSFEGNILGRMYPVQEFPLHEFSFGGTMLCRNHLCMNYRFAGTSLKFCPGIFRYCRLFPTMSFLNIFTVHVFFCKAKVKLRCALF